MIADDPKEIAAILVEENGAEGALDVAMTEITRANQSCDYYSLSVWREVRTIIRKQVEPEDEFVIHVPVDRF